MSTFTIDELDREEIEFLPPRVVMTTCNPCCRPRSCAPTLQLCVKVVVCGIVDCTVTAS
jgi:hypothetical protein